jgi:putative ABC transport system ATP-binding protein
VSTGASTAVEIRDVSYTFGSRALTRRVLSDLSLSVNHGEIVLLTGPSGSGKTTLLSLVGGLRAVQRGSCVVLGQELAGATEVERVALRRRVGFVFQDHHLLGFLTAAQNVAMSLELDRTGDERDRRLKSVAMLQAVGLGDHADAAPSQLSGGQRQRVAVARALVHNPSLILADEPTAALDRQGGQDLMALMSRLVRETGVTLLMVTHDTRVLRIADRVLMMDDGRIDRFTEQ